MQNGEIVPGPEKKPAKMAILAIGIVVFVGILFYLLRVPDYEDALLAPEDTGTAEESADAVSFVRVAEDGKSVIDADTGEAIFTIEAAKRYLRGAGYTYDEETFQTSDAKLYDRGSQEVSARRGLYV